MKSFPKLGYGNTPLMLTIRGQRQGDFCELQANQERGRGIPLNVLQCPTVKTLMTECQHCHCELRLPQVSQRADQPIYDIPRSCQGLLGVRRGQWTFTDTA